MERFTRSRPATQRSKNLFRDLFWFVMASGDVSRHKTVTLPLVAFALSGYSSLGFQ